MNAMISSNSFASSILMRPAAATPDANTATKTDTERSGANDPDFSRLDTRSMSIDQHRALMRTIIRNAHARRAAELRAMGRGLLSLLRNAIASGRDRLPDPAIRFVATIGRCWRPYAEWRQRQRDIAALHALSDYALKDIGLRRSEIYWVSQHGRNERSTNASGNVPMTGRRDRTSASPQKTSGLPDGAKKNRRAA